MAMLRAHCSISGPTPCCKACARRPAQIPQNGTSRPIANTPQFRAGIEENRAAIELFLRYAYEQGIARRLVTPEEIFPPGIDVKVAV